MTLKQGPIRFLRHPDGATTLLVLVVLAVLPVVGLSASGQVAVTTAMIFAVGACGLTIFTGVAGQPSLGNFAFAAFGAYIPTILTARTELSLWWGLVVALVATVVVSAALGAAMVRLRQVGATLVTLFVAFVVPTLISGSVLVEYTGATNGLLVPLLKVGDETVSVGPALYYLALVFLVVAAVAAFLYATSLAGARLRVIKRSEAVAATLGIRVHRSKIVAFCFSAVTACGAGFVLAQSLGAITPSSFEFLSSLLLFAMVIVGGSGTVAGAVLGALLLSLILNYSGDAPGGRELVYSVVLLVMLVFLPHGLFPEAVKAVRSALGAVLSRGRERAAEAPDGPRRDVVSPPSAQADPDSAPLPVAERQMRLEGGRPLLVGRQLGVRFGGVVALDSIDITVLEGSIHAVIGPNGAGKTTLLNCLSGLQTIDSGTVEFAGEPFVGATPQAWRQRSTARSFQHPALAMDLTVRENVAVGAMVGGRRQRRGEGGRTDPWQRADEVMEMTGLARYSGVVAANLSLAQQKLVDLARAMASFPRLLLLDEPTAGLEEYEIAALGQLIRELNERHGTTIVVVAHHIGFVRSLATRLTVLDFGRTIAEGPVDEVMEQDKVTEAFMGVKHVAQ
jgi:branched-chain amino acid transport system permease protein